MDYEIENLKSGMIWKTLSTGINALAGFIMSIIFARFLGKDVYGELILVYTVVTLFMSLSNFGLSAALLRFIPIYIKEKDEKRFTRFTLTAVGLGIFFTLFFSLTMFFLSDFISARVFNRPSLAIFMKWGVLYLFTFSLLTNIVFSLYHGFQRWKEECLLNGVYFSLSILSILAALAIFDKGIIEILKINALLGFGVITIGVLYIRRFMKMTTISLKAEYLLPELKEALSFSAPVLVSELLFYLIFRLDKIFLGIYRPMAELSQYYVAFAISTGIMMFIKVSETVFAPYLAKIAGEKDDILKRRFQSLFRIFLHLPIIFLIGLYFLVDPIIETIYGPDFEIAAVALKISLVIILLRSGMMPIGLFLVNVYGKTFEVTKISIVNALAHFILYPLLIPKYGYRGTLMATIIGYALIWIYIMLFIKEIKRLIPYRSLLYAGMGLAAVLFVNLAAHLCGLGHRYLLFAASPLLYALLIFLTKDFGITRIKNAV